MTSARSPAPNSLARSVSAVVLEKSANARALEGLSSSALVAATAGAQVSTSIFLVYLVQVLQTQFNCLVRYLNAKS